MGSTLAAARGREGLPESRPGRVRNGLCVRGCRVLQDVHTPDGGDTIAAMAKVETRIGADTGGTFTDLVRIAPDGVTVKKVPSTPADPGAAVVSGLELLGEKNSRSRLVHGTTVGTNALLTRSAGPVAFLTTKGFRDVLAIGRQARPDLYDLEPAVPPPLVPRRLRFEVAERMLPDGAVRTPLDEAAVTKLIPRLERAGVRAVAIGFLHAYANAAHERRAAAILRKAGFAVCTSSEVLPVYREYERFSTTAVNAFVQPVVGDYLRRLARAAGGDRLAVMQSNGGILAWKRVAAQPARTVLSGPAGGVVAALEAGRRIGVDRIVSFDMGGTSTDVSLADGEPRRTTEFVIDGLPVALPVLDILTVGAGGGSIARVDEGRALVVGPESAGAVPGPIAYGRGGAEITVTDAHVYLGRLPADRFLGGEMRLAPERLDEPFRVQAKRAGMTPVTFAKGILTVVEANMERAIRVISLERGHDPADFTLVSFGGAGGLHAARLAGSLGMKGVLVPPHPGAFSAIGMATADVVQDASTALLKPLTSKLASTVGRVSERLARGLLRSMAAEGMAEPTLITTLDLRYRGQSFEIPVDLDADLDLLSARTRFHEAHERLYRARHEEREVEAVTLRVRAIGAVDRPEPAPHRSAGRDPSRALDETSEVRFAEGEFATAFYARDRLRAGNRIPGPAIVTETTGTTVIPPGHRARVDRWLNLLITTGGEA